jgi:hypothetical protein
MLHHPLHSLSLSSFALSEACALPLLAQRYSSVRLCFFPADLRHPHCRLFFVSVFSFFDFLLRIRLHPCALKRVVEGPVAGLPALGRSIGRPFITCRMIQHYRRHPHLADAAWASHAKCRHVLQDMPGFGPARRQPSWLHTLTTTWSQSRRQLSMGSSPLINLLVNHP